MTSKSVGLLQGTSKSNQILPCDARYQVYSNAIFQISGSDPQCIYDLLKFYDFQWQTAMFTFKKRWKWCFLKLELNSC